MTRISVCIATHERSDYLRRTLAALERQIVPPFEVVVSDSSRATGPDGGISPPPSLRFRRVPSERRALPWQRYWAFRHATGDVILFLDDDVTLAPAALATLERAYEASSRDPAQKVAGIGFRMVYEDGTEPTRRASSLRERWLGMSSLSPGSLTPGGLSVALADVKGDRPFEVDALWGGAMSYRREALTGLPLRNLVALYEAGIGRGEDAVLSTVARRAGRLFALTEPLAAHPVAPQGATPYAKAGWRLGLTQTFGRAHTMRWMASSLTACRSAWWRLVVLEVARSGAALVSRPWQPARWLRLAGTLWGIGLALARWSRIPPRPD